MPTHAHRPQADGRDVDAADLAHWHRHIEVLRGRRCQSPEEMALHAMLGRNKARLNALGREMASQQLWVTRHPHDQSLMSQLLRGTVAGMVGWMLFAGNHRHEAYVAESSPSGRCPTLPAHASWGPVGRHQEDALDITVRDQTHQGASRRIVDMRRRRQGPRRIGARHSLIFPPGILRSSCVEFFAPGNRRPMTVTHLRHPEFH
jgi:hypothetical protein